MDKVIGVEIPRTCSKAEVEGDVRALEGWFYQHGRWIFASRKDSVQKLLGEQRPENDSDLNYLSKYIGKRDNFVQEGNCTKSKIFCELQKQGMVTRMAICEDSLEASLVNISIKQHPQEVHEILAVRIDSLFAHAKTSLEEFKNDRLLCYRKCIEHGEQVLERMIERKFLGGEEEEVVAFPETRPIEEPPLWFVVPCANKSVGECLEKALSYDLLKFKAIDPQGCVSVRALSAKQHYSFCAMKIFIHHEELKKLSMGYCYES